jgi:hypothetical protein
MALTPQSRSVLAEAERDCSKHTFGVRVRYFCNPLKHRTSIVAGLLRVLADHTDGYCANRDANDVDLTKSGMLFHFTSDVKRDEFMQAIQRYLRKEVRDCLTVNKV